MLGWIISISFDEMTLNLDAINYKLGFKIYAINPGRFSYGWNGGGHDDADLCGVSTGRGWKVAISVSSGATLFSRLRNLGIDRFQLTERKEYAKHKL